MVQEELHPEASEVIADDNAVVSWEQSLEVSQAVEEEVNLLDRILWRLKDTEQAGKRVNELWKMRDDMRKEPSGNDNAPPMINKIEIKKAA